MRIKLFLSTFLFASLASAQVTIGLLYQDPTNEPGTVLFAPIANKTTYLIDKCGYNLHSWTSDYKPGNSVYLLGDGTLLHSGNTNNPVFGGGGGGGGIIEKIDWNGTVTWSYLISDATMCQHHDIHPLPNGNVLAIVWEEKTQAQAIAAGRDPAFLNTTFWNEKIMEIQPIGATGGTVVWEWNVWDHLIQDMDSTKANYGVVSEHPELVNINANPNSNSNEDWLHLNSIDYNPALDQLVLSSRIFSEIWIIDHSTTTAESGTHAGGNSAKGGDLLYRWGNPEMYNRGTVADRKFFGQHSANWIKQGLVGEGDLMVFNNGKDRPAGDYSSVEVIKAPVDSIGNYSIGVTAAFQPDSAYWEYHDPIPTNLFSNNISGAQRLPNGHTLICDGNDGIFIEIDSAKNIVWKYKNPVNGMGPRPQGVNIMNNNSFRALFYEQSYSGFAGHPLSGTTPIETSPVAYTCDVTLAVDHLTSNQDLVSVYPNPVTDKFEIVITKAFEKAAYKVVDVSGKLVMEGAIRSLSNEINANGLSSGVYILQITIDSKTEFRKLIK